MAPDPGYAMLVLPGLPGADWLISSMCSGAGDPSLDKHSGVISPDILTWLGEAGALLKQNDLSRTDMYFELIDRC